MRAMEPLSAVDLTVVAPMFNEEANVARTWERVRDGLADLGSSWELVMVDDGSTDDSRRIAEELAATDARLRVVGYATNKGRGSGLRTGFAAARGRIVVSVDFDLSYSVDQVRTLFTYLEEHPDADVVLGSIYMPGGKAEGVPAFRLLVSKLGNKVLALALQGRFHTVTAVFRGYRRAVLRQLDLASDGKEIHLEILARCDALGFNVREIPATLRPRKRGSSKFRFGGTAVTHLLFSFAQRPMLLFGAGGAALVLAGAALGLWAASLSLAGTQDTTRLWILVVLLCLGGAQAVAFGFLAILVGSLHRELYRLQGRVQALISRDANERDAPNGAE